MSYANGRVYTEVVGGQKVGVSIYDVQRALQTGIVTDVKGLCAHQNVNPWARYKPIPCIHFNGIAQLTEAQRMQERYGIDPPIDMFTADTIQQYENYANGIENHNGYYLRIRPWGNSHFGRLHDFVKTGYNNAGYDHNAKCDNVVVTVNQLYDGERLFSLSPLISEGNREMYLTIGEAARFQFPNDHIWVDEYFKYVMGEQNRVTNIERHEEWLSPMDLVGANTYYNEHYPTSYVSVLRGVIIFMRNNADTAWVFCNKVTDLVGGSTYDRQYSAANKNAYLDLTRKDDEGYNDIDLYMFNQDPADDIDANAYLCINQFRTTPPRDYSNYHDNFLWNLEGRYLFVEFWKESNSSVNEIPIPGLAYEVIIHRTSAPTPPVAIHAYIVGVFEFNAKSTGTAPLLVEVDTTSSPATTIQFEFLINPNTFLEDGDALNNNDGEGNARLVMTRMRNHYDSFVIKFYNSQNQETLSFDLFSDMIEVTYQDYVVEGVTWNDCLALIYDASGSIDVTGWTAKAFATIKQQGGITQSGQDTLAIRTQ